MKKTIKKGYLALIALAVLAILVIASIGYTNSRVDMANRAKDAKYSEDVGALDAEIVKLGNEKVVLIDEKDVLEGEKITLENTIVNKDIELLGKDAEIAELTDKVTAFEAEEEIDESSYVMDELEIGKPLKPKTLTDRQIDLFDGEVEFSGKDYDAKEIITLDGLVYVSNGDYEENPYLEIPEGAIKYRYEVSFDTTMIGNDDVGGKDYSDETLTINLLGKEVEISKWEDDKLTLTSGTEYLFEEGESKEIDGQTVTVVTISDTTKKILVKVGDESEVIYELETESFNDLDVYVKEILPNEAGEASPDIVTLKIGKDIETEIEDGEYDEDDDNNVWKWTITKGVIELTNEEAFEGFDEDEEFNALGAGESICLPDYRCIRFDGLTQEDENEYTFDLKSSGNIKIDGNFIYDNELYTELYLIGDIFYDGKDDTKDNQLNVNDIFFGDSDKKLEIPTSGTIWTYTGINFKYDATHLWDLIVDGSAPIDGEEDNYRSNYGAIVMSPEDNLDNNEVRLSIPEEQLFGSITVY